MTALGNVPLKFQLTEFSDHRFVEWNTVVAENLPYGIIIGRDLMEHLGLLLDFRSGTITWDGPTVEMKSRAIQAIKETPQALMSLLSNETIHQAERRQIEILEADNKPELLEDYNPSALLRSRRTY